MFQPVPNPVLDGLLTIVIYLVAIYNYLCLKRNKKGTGYFYFLVLIILYSLFYRPLGGDFWGYYEEYLGLEYGRHMEDFYYWLISIIPNNYILWRLAVWGGAAICISMVFRIMKVPGSIATPIFLLLGLAAYYYTRNALALSVLYLAIAIIVCSPEKSFWRKWVKWSIVVVLFLSSWYLHRSMPLYMGVAIVALFLPFNRNYILGAIIAFPLLYGVATLISSNIFNITDIWLEEGTGMNYLEAENTASANWKGVIGLFIRYSPIFYFYYIGFKYPIENEDRDFIAYKTFLLFSFFVIVISFLFYGQGSASIQGRLYKSALIPFSFTAALYFKHFYRTKRCDTFVALLVVYYVWKTLVPLV